MPDPIASAAVSITGGGLYLFGVATGLDIGLLLAGFAGSMAALSYIAENIHLRRRLMTVIVGTLGAAWVAPALAPWLAKSSPIDIPVAVLQFPIALGIGFLSFTVIAPGMLRIAARRMDQEAGK